MEFTDKEKSIISQAGMGRRIGFGKRPALIIIDMQIYMMGDKREPILESIKTFPSSCGEMAWDAADNIRLLIDACHSFGAPVIYTFQSIRADGSDAGPFKMKRDLLQIDNWFIEGTHGAQIAPSIKPEPQDFVFMKKRPSAFFGSPLSTYLIGQSVDTLIVTGGSTSNCVRATVFDSASYGYRTLVASDGVCDRIETSHAINLRDMDRQFADVMTTQEILNGLKDIDMRSR
jgi:Amidases related to nicotinamidase